MQLEINHGNQVFSRDIRITDFRDMAKLRGNCPVQFYGALHAIGQGGLALSQWRVGWTITGALIPFHLL